MKKKKLAPLHTTFPVSSIHPSIHDDYDNIHGCLPDWVFDWVFDSYFCGRIHEKGDKLDSGIFEAEAAWKRYQVEDRKGHGIEDVAWSIESSQNVTPWLGCADDPVHSHKLSFTKFWHLADILYPDWLLFRHSDHDMPRSCDNQQKVQNTSSKHKSTTNSFHFEKFSM